MVEVRAHDGPGLLWRIGRALGECGLDVRAARVETLGAEAVDVFYVAGADGCPVTDAPTRGQIAAQVLSVLTGEDTPQSVSQDALALSTCSRHSPTG